MSAETTTEETRKTVCGNCDVTLYQTADPNNIHWYHEGTGDVRCPIRFAKPVSPPASAAPVVDNSVAFNAYNQAIEDAKAAIRAETTDADGSGFFSATFINAIARKCSPHVYVNQLAAAAAPVGNDSIPLLGYERVITIEWDKHNARRHELIEAKRSRLLSEDEIVELHELQWLAGIKRELLTGPNVAAPVEQSDTRPSCWHCGVVLAEAPKLRCEDCPEECDVEGCDELGCAPTKA